MQNLLSSTSKTANRNTIIYCHDCHWVAAYKEDPNSDGKIYNSLFDTADDVVTTVIANYLFIY